ncbi:MAG TPA: SufD family Fe-S cluster assembly protein [Acidimicrobiales bacterium]|nr:SufD family Fe-S cluster assembly protein [Acidimicrobiales bacterium]
MHDPSGPASFVGAPLSGFIAESSAALGGPEWLRAKRRAAFERFQAWEMPTESLEEWRYSRIEQLDLHRFAPATAPGGTFQRHPGGDLASELLQSIRGDVTVVETVDGFLSELSVGPASVVEIDDLSNEAAAEREHPERRPIAEDPDPYVTLNRAFAPSWISLRVPRRSHGGVVVLVHRISQSGVAAFPRVSVELGQAAELSVVEIFAGAAGSLVVPVTELELAEGAHLGYLNVQVLDESAWQVGFQPSRVERDASLVSAAVAAGGEYARLRTDSTLVGPGASGRLLALYFGSGDQMHDFRTVQHHAAPKTQSDLLYKGVVANTSRSVYSGLIRVDKGARGTNAMQTNRNLVLHEGAHADSVPNLEIEDNDVRCSHASAVGPIAEDQRFYLESRGVPTPVADRLIAIGFLDEVLEQLPVSGIAAPLRASLVSKLTEAELLEQRSAT